MRIAFDTNVLISAYTARGLSADVFRLALARHEIILSDAVLDEFQRVLTTRFGIPEQIVAEFVDELALHHVQLEVSIPIGSLDFIPDPDDRVVVAKAVSANASVLLTGDKHILGVRDRFKGLVVNTPREFWESLRSKGE